MLLTDPAYLFYDGIFHSLLPKNSSGEQILSITHKVC